MGMVYCRGCGQQIHETAPSCPHCGAPQGGLAPASVAGRRTSWEAIVSLILGIVAMLAMLDDSEWDLETCLGVGMLAIGGIVCGAIDLSGNNGNRGLSIAGVVLSAIALLALIGLAFE